MQDQSAFAFGGITPINPSPVDLFPKPKKMGSIDLTDDHNLLPPFPKSSDRSKVEDLSHININVEDDETIIRRNPTDEQGSEIRMSNAISLVNTNLGVHHLIREETEESRLTNSKNVE